MKYGTVSLILEIEKVKSNKVNQNRYYNALSDLQKSKIKGHRVISLWAKGPHVGCEVPHFEHNYLCDENCGKNEKAVLRYFNIDLIIDNPKNDIMGVYKLNDFSQIHICGVPIGIKVDSYKELEIINN